MHLSQVLSPGLVPNIKGSSSLDSTARVRGEGWILLAGVIKGGARPKNKKNKKKWPPTFQREQIFFFVFLAWLPALSLHSTTKAIYSLKGGWWTLLAGGIRAGGGGQGQKKKKIGLPFFRGGRFFFFFLAWLPAPSLHSTTRTISSRNNFAELKPSEYEPIRHYLDTTILQVIHSIGYNSKIVVFMHPAKPGPQGDAFCILTYVLL